MHYINDFLGTLPTLQIRNSRLREVIQLSQITKTKHGSWDSSRGLSQSPFTTPEALSLYTNLPPEAALQLFLSLPTSPSRCSYPAWEGSFASFSSPHSPRSDFSFTKALVRRSITLLLEVTLLCPSHCQQPAQGGCTYQLGVMGLKRSPWSQCPGQVLRNSNNMVTRARLGSSSSTSLVHSLSEESSFPELW